MLISMALAGWILDEWSGGESLRQSVRQAVPPESPLWTGFAITFGLGAVLGCVDIILHSFVPEPRPQPVTPSRPLRERLLTPLREPNFRSFTLAIGVFTFAVGLISLGPVFLKREFQTEITYTHLAVITIAANVGMIVCSLFWGYVLDRIGGRAFGLVMLLLAPLIMSVWFFVEDYAATLPELTAGVPLLGGLTASLVELLPQPLEGWLRGLVLPQPIWLIILANLGAGAFYGGVGLCQANLAGALAPREGRTMAMAMHWSVVGLLGASGPVVAGRVMDWFAADPVEYVFPTGTVLGWHHLLVLAHVGLIWLVVLPILSRVRRGTEEPHMTEAMSRLFVPNVLRAASNIYAMTAPVSRSRRAAAARDLGSARTAIAVRDLIDRLEDPSGEVREEAVQALGSIGGAEAVDALVAKLEDPESDLAPQIAKALRSRPDPKSVEALVRRLQDPDRETRTETARTLGAIGDRRAVPVLLELLRGTTDAKVVSASSEALSRLGELAAIYEILPRLKETRNPVLRRSLAVAVGDLLGEPEGFYKVLTREQQTPGSEAERLLKELARRVRAATRRQLAAEGAAIVQRLEELQHAYDEEAWDTAAELLFAAGLGLAALRYGVAYGGDAEALVEELVWQDPRFGVGVWYLALLREGWEAAELGARDEVDILLGIYFLASRGLAQ
jgi:HEAT repeat protein